MKKRRTEIYVNASSYYICPRLLTIIIFDYRNNTDRFVGDFLMKLKDCDKISWKKAMLQYKSFLSDLALY